MSGNRLLTAIVVLAGLLAITVWQFNKREAEDAKPSDIVAKLPDVKKDDVTELTVQSPGKPAITMKKVDGAWKVTAPVAADGDKDAIDTALSKLDELQAVAVAATKPENHERLEVTEAKGVHVSAKQGDKVVADLWLGAYLSGNTMVREQGAVNVMTAKGSIKYGFDKELKEWRDRVIVDTPADQVTAATFSNQNGTWKFVKEGSDWKQAPGEKEIKEFDASKVGTMVSAVASLRANDFAAEGVTAETAGVGASPVGTVTLQVTSDAGNSQILVRVGNKQDVNYYAMREGKEPIYVVSQYSGERMLPTVDKFAKDPPKAAAATPGMVPVSPKKVVPGAAPGIAEAMMPGHGHGHGH